MDRYKSKSLPWDHYISLLVYYLLLLLLNVLIFFKYFINKDFKLKSYLLVIKDLKDIYNNKYMNSVLLKALEDFRIEYNITK
jgi:Tfp pilus assembly protein PilO